MNFFERRRILKRYSTMDLIPVRCYPHEVLNKKIIVLYPKFKSRLVKCIAPRTAEMFFRIRLDELGSLTWKTIDGERNVQEIYGNIIKVRANEKAMEDIENRLTKYIMVLYQKRLITFKQLLNK